jgi:multiple antibiotic resistance protein
MTEFFIDSFILLFIVLDPIGLVPIFVALTRGEDAPSRRRLALHGTAIALAILLVFVVIGERLLQALGIGMPAFQIAGGALLFLLAVEMVFARPSGIRFTTEREQREARQRRDISVFPLAFPLIAGPGALTTVLLMVGTKGAEPVKVMLVLLVVVILLAVTALALLAAPWLMRRLGETGANVISRVLGVVLAALAVQYMLDGIRAGF